MITRLSFVFIPLMCLLGALSGCGSAVDPKFADYREVFLLSEDPGDTSSISEAREHLNQNSAVTIEAQIDLKNFAATEDEKNALVLLRELSDEPHASDPNHDPESCPFCKRKAKLAQNAVVQFIDENGEVVPHSVQELFQVQHGDIVVVRGQGEYSKELDLFSVKANGIFVRSRSSSD